jgi:general secretion pathway protein A
MRRTTSFPLPNTGREREGDSARLVLVLSGILNDESFSISFQQSIQVSEGREEVFLNFYGLREQPFGVTPDPRFLYLSPAHREALASLYYGIESGCGFLALIAKPGMGKTTLLFQLLDKFRGQARTAFLFQTQCSSREFMRFLLAELGSESNEQDFVRMNDEFNKLLLQEARAGRRFIIVVDEAQNLHPSVLETVRLLSDFETPQAKLLQIILAGQPELADKLATRKVSQLRQRLSSVSGLTPLSLEESTKYIGHRLRIAGHSGAPLFDPPAMQAIVQFTEGIPRNLNNFCFSALSLGCALRERKIGLGIVAEVISDLDITKHVTEARTLPPLNPELLGSAATNNSLLSPAALYGMGKDLGTRLTPTEAKAYMQNLVLQMRNQKPKPD